MKDRGPRAPSTGRLAVLAAVAAALLTGCAGEVITKTGRETSNLYNVVLVMATVVFVAVEIAIIWQVVKYRRRRGEENRGLPPQIHGNRQIEIVWTALPSIIIAVLFVLSMVVLNNVNHVSANPDLTVRVIGYQWQWTFEYLDENGKPMVTEAAKGQNEGPTLVLPTERRVHFELVSGDGTNDVIHSFYIPAFFFKRDVVPGRTNGFDVTLDRTGDFIGECAEFCGDFHNAMIFDVRSVEGSQFDTWLAEEAKKQAEGPECAPEGDTVQVVAEQITFDTDCLAAPADQPFTITFENKDSGVPHNVDVLDKEGGTHVFGANGASDVVTGVATTTYQVSPQKPGSYFFVCDIHPTAMFGTFIVK